MTDITLLPPNRTVWEVAVATVEAERVVPTQAVASVSNPDTCPAHLLPYLAASLSVDVWDDSWPETKKREACRKAFLFHRLKTTLAGIKAHVAMAGSEVRRAIRPPASGFLYAAMTDAQRRAWLDDMPQIRVYPFYRRSTAVRRRFCTGPGARHQFHGGRRFSVGEIGLSSPLLHGLPEVLSGSFGVVGPGLASPLMNGLPSLVEVDRFSPQFTRKNRGRSLSGRRATLFDRGVEIEVGYEALDGIAAERIFIGRTRKRGWHDGSFSSRYLTSTQADTQVITVRTDESLGLAAITAGLVPVDVRPQRINQGRIAPLSRAFFGRFGGFQRASFGPLMIYDRISIHDPSRIGARRKTRSYHGYGRFGVPDYSAELRIRVPMTRGRRRSGRWHGIGFRAPADMAPLRKAIEAVRVSKAFRDTVLIDTATYGQVTFSGGLRFGEFSFGEIKEVR